MSSYQLLKFHDGERWISSLVTCGTKKAHILHIDGIGLRVTQEPKESLRYAQPLLLRGQPYPLDRALRRFRSVGRRIGMSAEAKRMLEAAALETGVSGSDTSEAKDSE